MPTRKKPGKSTPQPLSIAARVEALLESQALRRRCRICDHPEVSSAIDQILDAMDSGKARVSAPAVARWIKEQFGVEACPSLLRQCAQVHRGRPWGAAGK